MSRIVVVLFVLLFFISVPALAEDDATATDLAYPEWQIATRICISPASANLPAEETAFDLDAGGCPPGHMSFLAPAPSTKYQLDMVDAPRPLTSNYQPNR